MHRSEHESSKSSGCCSRTIDIPKDSSVPLVALIFQSKSNKKRALYFAILIICSCLCFLQVFKFMNVYLKYPVLTRVDVVSKLNAEFPAVTVCNLNRMKQRSFESHNAEMHSGRENVSLGGTMVFTMRRFLLSLLDLDNSLSTNLNRTYLDVGDSGYQFSELVEFCSFGGFVPCDERNFTLFRNLQYGNCFTFNKDNGIDHRPKLTSHQLGSDFGLELILNVHADDYVNVTPSVGMRLVIHNPDEDPDPVESGVNISPGFEVHLAMTKSSLRRLPPPYRDRCLDYKGANNPLPFRSQLECVRNCTQSTSFTRCSCGDPFLFTDFGKWCDLANSTEMACLDAVLDDMRKNGLPCYCPIACAIDFFKTEISSSAWKEKVNSSTKFMEHSKANLKVFFKDFETTIYSQTPMFTENEIISHVGGLFSLWLGLSVLTLYEFFEKAVILLKNLVS